MPVWLPRLERFRRPLVLRINDLELVDQTGIEPVTS